MDVDGAEVEVRVRWYEVVRAFGMPIPVSTDISRRADAYEVTIQVLGEATRYVDAHGEELVQRFA